MAWIYPYSLINLTLKAKKCIFIYENWLIVTIIYHSSQIGNRSGILVKEGRVEEIWFRKTTKSQKIGGVAINEGSGRNIAGETCFVPA